MKAKLTCWKSSSSSVASPLRTVGLLLVVAAAGVGGQYWNFATYHPPPFTAFGPPSSSSPSSPDRPPLTGSTPTSGHQPGYGDRPGPHRTRFDHIVIGAGILGSWTAYHLASRGKYVLLLDQFPLPHSRGSSSGQSRGIELASTDEQWIPHLLDSYPWWRKLEDETGENLFEYHDLLIITEVPGGWPAPQIDRLMKLFKTKTARRLLDPVQVRKYYPDLEFRNVSAGFIDGSGGILLAAKILNALRGRIKDKRGVIRDQCQVVRIDPGPPASVLCRGHLDTFTADSVVIAAGPWTSKILKRIGLDVKIQSSLGAHMYFPAKEGASIGDISFIHYDTDKRFRAWTHPEVEYPGLVKLGIGLWIPVDPDKRDQSDPRPMRDAGVAYVKEHLKCLNESMAIYDTCMYYHIEDKRHIVSAHPYYDNIIVGAAAGSGFKIAPILSTALADLAMKKRPSIDIASFSLQRYMPEVVNIDALLFPLVGSEGMEQLHSAGYKVPKQTLAIARALPALALNNEDGGIGHGKRMVVANRNTKNNADGLVSDKNNRHPRGYTGLRY